MEIEIQKSSTVFNPVYVLWFWCSGCGERQEQEYIQDEGIYEVYRCACGHINRKAVR